MSTRWTQSEDIAMSQKFEIEEDDARLAEEINREARSNPSSPYAGKYVAIAGGKVVATGERLDNVVAELERVVPERNRGLVFEASADYDTAHEIWGLDR